VALLLVLWTFAVLSALAAEFARAMREEAQSALNFKQETGAHYVAVAALNEALLALQAYNGELELGGDGADGEFTRTTQPIHEEEAERLRPIKTLLQGTGDWVKGRFGPTEYEVRAIDESGKVPINAPQVEEDLLQRIMLNLGYDEDVAATVSDSILDWRDEDDLHRTNGAEDDYYEDLDRPYQSKDAPFSTIEELLLVRGVTDEMYHGDAETPGLKDIFSAVARTRHLTLRSISPEVEYAVCGTEREDTEGGLDAGERGLGAGEVDSDEDLASCIATTGLGSRRGERGGNAALSTATVEARVKDESGRVLTHVGMTVHFKGGGFRTVYWYDAMFPDES
jgi:general secretion pathway protein K